MAGGEYTRRHYIEVDDILCNAHCAVQYHGDMGIEPAHDRLQVVSSAPAVSQTNEQTRNTYFNTAPFSSINKL